jgi:hypothetical protein
MVPPLSPLFAGTPIFGDAQSFTSTQVYVGFTSAVDSFLNLPPGTTRYGNDRAGRMWLCSGVLLGSSVNDVLNQQAVLMGFANGLSVFMRPTGLAWPSNGWNWSNSRFLPSEVVFQAIAPYAGGQFQSPYSLVMRQVSNS